LTKKPRQVGVDIDGLWTLAVSYCGSPSPARYSCYGQSLASRLIGGASFASTTSPLRENVAALTAIISAIPLGFIVRQAYYVFYSLDLG
jgi:hypothetical protein